VNVPPSHNPQATYCPPSPDILEHFAYTLCHELGSDYADPEVVRGFASFLNTTARICANNLNRKLNGEFENRVE
jgi:hypothetical protein